MEIDVEGVQGFDINNTVKCDLGDKATVFSPLRPLHQQRFRARLPVTLAHYTVSSDNWSKFPNTLHKVWQK